MTAPRAVLAGFVALLMTVGALGGSFVGSARADSAPLDPADPATPTTVTADALPTVQINGVVWSQVVVGNTVYAAGEFTRARPAGAAAGSQETVRNNLLAYDIRTGELITSFAPNLNAQALVVAASPDGSRIYVGGDFTQANGQARNRIAAYSTATGQLLPDFRPNVSSRVYAIAATNSTVYIGGTFTAVGSAGRHRLAAVSAANGALLPWRPVPGTGPVLNRNGNTATSDVVRALVVTGGGTQVVAAGHFDTLNGVKATGVGALDAVSGNTRPFAVNQLITNQGINSAVNSLSTDGTNVYGTAFDYYGPGNLEGSFSAKADGGAVNWIGDCHGDHYSNHPLNGALYMAGHPHVCSNIGGFHEHSPRIHRYATAVSLAATGTVGTGTLCNSRLSSDGTVVHRNSTGTCSGVLLQGKPAPSLLTWFPTMAMGTYTGQYQSGWSVAGNDQYVVYGGEFPRVNGTGQQGLVRYAIPSGAPNRIGPAAGDLAAAVDAPFGGMARVSWSSTNDRDNEHLTYRVYRDGGSDPVYEVTRSSMWWSPQPMGFMDLGVPAGTHTYRVSAFDPLGNRANSPWMSVNVPAGTMAQRSYSDAVRADGAQHYWPLGERSGATAYNHAGASDLAVREGRDGATPKRGVAGAITKDADTAYQFLGMSGNSSLGYLSAQSAAVGLQTFTLEAWFRTTSTRGGKMVGFGNRATGNSSTYDRHIYMDTGGRVHFGVYPGAMRSVGSTRAYNDGRWHHVAASLSPSGMQLYVDGVRVGSRTDTTSAQHYSGYWRVGGDSSWSGDAYFAGDIDEVAVYPSALSADRIANHHSLGSTGQATNVAPTARFTTAVEGLTASFDASASTDDDGTIVSYAWDFGDGATGTGVTPSHTYAGAGTYTVTLTVTDDDGATARTSATVAVTDPPPNVAPSAVFTTAASGLWLSVDGSSSTDSDGSVASYSWDFGDGATGTGATAKHEYSAAGSYTVKLTVTDDDGATGTAEKTVSVVEATVLASDAFDRTVTGGLGTADVGGDWTVQFGGVRQSVSPGAATLNLAAPGNNTGSFLGEVSHDDVDIRTRLVVDGAPTGGGTFVYVAGRRVSATELYRARLRFLTDGTVRVAIARLSGSFSETLIGGEVVVPGVRSTPGTPLNVRLQVKGTGTTELAATVWGEGSEEPAEPTVTRTDSTAALQKPGGVGISAYLSGSATEPVAVRFTVLTAVPTGAAAPAPEPAENQAPTAAFTAAVEGLSVSVDGSSSTDPDGSVASYSWDFGDGATGTGATASHTYSAAGSYTVKLTVTDDDGATGTAEESVSVTAPDEAGDPEEPGDPAVLVADTFDRTVTGGLGTADVGGEWTVQFGGVRQSVSPGAATLNLAAPGNNTGSFLGGVSHDDVDIRTSLELEGAPTGGGTFVYVAGRRVSETELYRARLRFLPDGTVRVAIARLSGSFSETLIGAEVVVPGVSSTSSTPLNVRLQVKGTGTTELAATVWGEGSEEPAEPTVTRTDSTAALQKPGGVGISAYLSGSATEPVAVRFTGFDVRAIG